MFGLEIPYGRFMDTHHRYSLREIIGTVLIITCVTPLSAEDVVHVAIGENSRARTKLSGEILEYTGQTLLLRMPGGTERAFPADRVFRVETTYGTEQQAADRLFASGQVGQALPQYRLALQKEPRRWVRREILAQLVWCYRQQNDLSAAAQTFLVLLQSDPTTHLFDCIPLAWLSGPPAAGLESLAQRWMTPNTQPAAALLGASYLLDTPQRAAARERLNQLSFDGDPRIAGLAKAQVWRATFSTANDLQVNSWMRDVEQIPDSLRAGPYYTLGRMLAFRQRSQEAALAYLRVPILFPKHGPLAARCLLEAGRELEKIGQQAEAATLYRELLEKHPDSLEAREAKGRLETEDRGSKPR